jgi:hypothetical protein
VCFLFHPIWRGLTPSFVNYKKGCTQLAAASDKVYQLLAHGQWFSPGTPASSTTKTGRHDIAEILLKVALNTINQSNQIFILGSSCCSFKNLHTVICWILSVMSLIMISFSANQHIACISPHVKICMQLKAYRLSELIFLIFIRSCQYSMFYTNCS